MKKIIYFVMLSLSLAACSKNATLNVVNPDLELERKEDTGDLKGYDFNPTVEIVFILDDSASMEVHLNNVSNNINQFVDAFTKNSPFYWHAAVTSVYDSRTFLSPTYQNAFNGIEQIFDIGEFRNVTDENGKEVEGKKFLSSDEDNLTAKLKHSLKPKVRPLENGGPHREEIFYPMTAIYNAGPLRPTKETLAAQKDFHMGQNSYKVFFIVTDAADNSKTMTSDDAYLEVLSHTGGKAEKIMALGAIIPEKDKACKRDPGIVNKKLEDFLQKTKPSPSTQNMVSLCSGKFGQVFASFGQAVKQRILAQNVPLTQGEPDFTDPNSDDPEVGIFVTYGEQRIFLEAGAYKNIPGYTYDPPTRSITINPAFQFERKPGARLRVNYRSIHKHKKARKQVTNRGGA